MRIPAPVWRSTTVFFVSQLLIMLCCGLYLLQWSYSENPGQPAANSAQFATPALPRDWPLAASAQPYGQFFWHEAATTLQPFAGYALLILLGSSILFASYEILRASTSLADEP